MTVGLLIWWPLVCSFDDRWFAHLMTVGLLIWWPLVCSFDDRWFAKHYRIPNVTSKGNIELLEQGSNLCLTVYPFSISTDEHVPLNFLWRKSCTKRQKIQWTFNRTLRFLETINVDSVLSLRVNIFNSKHIMIFENKIQYSLITVIFGKKQHIKTFLFPLLTLNVHLQIGNRSCRGTCTPGWEPLF